MIGYVVSSPWPRSALELNYRQPNDNYAADGFIISFFFLLIIAVTTGYHLFYCILCYHLFKLDLLFILSYNLYFILVLIQAG